VLSKRDGAVLRDIERAALTLSLDGRGLLDDAIQPLAELLQIENVGLYALRNAVGRWELARWECVGPMRDAESALRRVLARAPDPLYYDPMAAPTSQRNRVVEALAWIERHAPGSWESSPMYAEVMRPLGLHEHRQPRVLLCDGPAVVGWLGAVSERPPSRRDMHILARASTPMRRRLIAERQLQHGAITRAALDAMLERLGSPAFIIDAKGHILEINAAGASMLRERRADVVQALTAVVAERPSGMTIERIAVAAPGMPACSIAIVRDASLDARVMSCVRGAARRWQLTPKQARVLELVIRGQATATIAAALAISERAVELHVTGLFDKVGVDSRSALVAAVLMAPG
jgi:DNA-binding CsgD family transcriptional regulator